MTNPEQGNGVHPRITAEQEELRSQEVLEGMQITASLWELKLEDARSRGLNHEQLGLIGSEAIADLDEKWPYHGEMFLLSGRWTYPQVHADAEECETDSGPYAKVTGVSWEYVEEDIFDTRYSSGWGYGEVNGRMRLGYTFHGNTTSVNGPYYSLAFLPMGFALPEEVSLSLITAPNEEQGQVHQERVHEALELYDRLLQLYVSREEFTALTHKKQLKLINDLLENVNETITSPNTTIYIETVPTEFYYRAETSTAYGFVHMPTTEKDREASQEMPGLLLGVTILEQSVLAEKPLRTDSDYIDKSAGLCLILEIYHDGEAQTIYVPYKSANVTADNIHTY